MKVDFPSHHRWFRKNTDNPLEYLTGTNGKKIRASVEHLASEGVHWSLKPLDKDFFKLFTPIYQQTISAKSNAIVHDIYAKTLGKEFIEFPYYGLSLFDGDTYVGGTIFSVREDRIAYAYRAYERTWPLAKLKAGPALIAEYIIAQFASENKLPFVSHGRDRNPYGPNSAIGLAVFKLSVGCRPLLTEDFMPETLETDELTEDALILLMPSPGDTYITEAVLVTDPMHEHRYEQVTKYPDVLKVRVLHRT